MRTTIHFLMILAATGNLASQSQAQMPAEKFEQEVVALVNEQRAANKLPPLRVNAQLMQAARSHSANMARQNMGSHVLDGKGPGDRLRELGYRGRFWGENIAWGARSPRQAMTGWMQSPPHRGNILNSNFDEIGVGVAYSSSGVPYWTQVFGRR